MTDALTAPVLHHSLSRDIWRQFYRHKGALGGAAVFALIAAAVLFGPAVHGLDPQYLDYRAKNQGMSLAHPLGTDNLGRDMFARVLAGGQLSLAVGIAAMALSLTLGTFIGVLAGFSQRLDGPLMRLTDLFLALPVLPLLLVAIMLFRDPLRSTIGPEVGIFVLIVAVIGITSLDADRPIVRGSSCREGKGSLFSLPAPSVRVHSGSWRTPVAQCAEPDHGFGHARCRASGHHRKRPEFPWPRLPFRFPDLGTSPLRWRALPRARTGTGNLARTGNFTHGTEHQLHGRRLT